MLTFLVTHVIKFSGNAGKITYTITTPDMPFSILDNGTIYTTAALDRETVAEYTLTVLAMDSPFVVQDRLTSTATVSGLPVHY